MASCHEVLSQVAALDSNECRLSYIHRDPILTFFNNLPGTKCISSDSSDDTADSEPEEYQCPCGRRFKRKAPFERHLDLAHSNRVVQSHKCKTCGKTFGNHNTLTMHMSVHNHHQQSSFATLADCPSTKAGTVVTPSVRVPQCDTSLNKRVTRATGPSAQSKVGTSVSEKTTDKSSKQVMKVQTLPMESTMDTKDTYDSSPLNNNVAKLVTFQHDQTVAEHIEIANNVTSTVEVSSEPMDTLIKEESDKENVEESSKQMLMEPVAVVSEASHTAIPQSSQQHVVIKVQKGPMMAPSGIATTGAGSHMVTIPLVMSNLSSPSTSSSPRVAQVYTFPATAAPVQVSQTMVAMTTAQEDLETGDAMVRKSARLTGKVPGWKSFLQEEHASQAESRPRKRRIGRVASEETETDSEIDNAVMGGDADDIDEGLKRQRTGKEDFPCEVCGKSFTSEKYLSMHSALHGAQNPADGLMTEDFKDQDGYLKSGNTWMCKICSKVFAQNSSFKNHMRTHSDERPYVCQVCSIGFKERYHLKKHHLFKHSTELKEKCRFCGKRFKDSTAVRAHERIHSEERPYSCRRCNKAFKTSECLWHHENRSKTCGQVAQTFPPTQRARRGRPSRKQQGKDQQEEVKPNVATVVMQQPPNTVGHMQLPIIQPHKSQQHVLTHSHNIIQHQTAMTHHHVPQHKHQQSQNVMVKSEPLSEEEYLEELDLVNQVIESVQATSNMESILKDVEDGPLLNEDGELLIPSEPDPPVATSELAEHLAFAASQTQGLYHTVSGHQIVTSHHPSGHNNQALVVTAPMHTSSNMSQPVFTRQIMTQPFCVSVAQTVQQHSGYAVVAQPVSHAAPLRTSLAVTPTQVQSSIQPEAKITACQPIAPAISQNQVHVSLSNHLVAHTAPLQAPVSQPINLPVCQPTSNGDPISIARSCPSQPVKLPTPRPIPSSHISSDQVVATTRPVATVQPVQRVTPTVIKKEVKQEPVQLTDLQSNYAKGKMSNFTCPKCYKGFAVQSAFQKHLQRHEEVRPFHCDICDLGFKLKVHLKKHNLYRHSSEYPCECKICGKKFKDSSAVRLHERIHSEARPFRCGCGKTFKTKENLWGHQHRKMCPMATDFPSNDDKGPVQAEASVSNGHVTASIKDNKIIAQAVVSNNKVTAQATISNTGELTAHASVISNSQFVSQASLNADGHAEVKVENPASSQQHVPSQASYVFTTTCSPSYSTASYSSSSPSSASSLPSFETFTSGMRAPNGPVYYMPPIKKESLADKCPTIQNLLKKGPTPTTKLPGIQQLFKAHMKPPPPYPGRQAPPGSPGHYTPRSNPVSPAPSQLMINPDQMYESSRGPYLRTPPPPPYNKSRDSSSSPYSDLSPGSCGAQTPGTPGGSSCSSGDSSMPAIIWDEDTERKPVVTQWQQQDPDALFHELSSTVLNQL